MINERSCVVVALLDMDLSDEDRTRRAHATAQRLVEEAGRRGFGEYRAHLDFMDLASDQYSFGGNACRGFCEVIKDARTR